LLNKTASAFLPFRFCLRAFYKGLSLIARLKKPFFPAAFSLFGSRYHAVLLVLWLLLR